MPSGWTEYLYLTPRFQTGNHPVKNSYTLTRYPIGHPKSDLLDLEYPDGVATLGSAREIHKYVRMNDAETLIVACYALAICQLNAMSTGTIITPELLKSTTKDIKRDLPFSVLRKYREWRFDRSSFVKRPFSATLSEDSWHGMLQEAC